MTSSHLSCDNIFSDQPINLRVGTRKEREMVVLHIKFEIVSLRGFEPPKLHNNLHNWLTTWRSPSWSARYIACIQYVGLLANMYILHVNLYNMHKKSSRQKLSFAQTSDDTATCELCFGRHIQFTAPEKWKSEEAHTLVVSLGLYAKSLIRSACRKDVTRCLSNDEYTPRWEKDISKNVTCCARLAVCCRHIYISQ